MEHECNVKGYECPENITLVKMVVRAANSGDTVLVVNNESQKLRSLIDSYGRHIGRLKEVSSGRYYELDGEKIKLEVV